MVAPGMQWAVNGEIYPRTPMFMVSEGDLVKMTIVNDTARFIRCTCTATICSS